MYTYIKKIENLLYKNHKCKIYYIYKITNLINSKIYIGKHIQNNYKIDNYLGSGNLIRMAVKKYGRSNFKKEILSYHSNDKELSIAESKAITETMVLDPIYYNLKPGGTGFSSGEFNPNKNYTYIINESNEVEKIKTCDYDKSIHTHAIASDNNGMFNKVIVVNDEGYKLLVDKNNIPEGYKFHLSGYVRDDLYKAKMSIACTGEKNGMYGKKHSEETKNKLRSLFAKKISVNGIIYDSINLAAIDLKVTSKYVRYRCDSDKEKFKDWYYL